MSNGHAMCDEVKTFYKWGYCTGATSVMLCTSIFALFFAAVQGETFLSGTKGVFPCVANTDVNDLYAWSDVTESDVQLYRVDGNGVAESPIVNTDAKYENFSVDNSNFPTSVSMSINPVTLQQIGTYECVVFNIAGFKEEVTLEVEVIPSAVDIDTNGSEFFNADERYRFTCTAVGVRSPNMLTLQWSTSNEVSTPLTDRKTSTLNSELEDLNSTFSFMPKKDDKFVKCSIMEYVNQNQINEDDISDTLQINVRYAPICILEVSNEEVGDSSCSVILTCTCDANPAVTAGDYSYFKGNDAIEGNDFTTTANVELETTEEFSCSGSNVVRAGDQSATVPYTCTSPTTVPSTTDITTVTTMIDITPPMTTVHVTASTTSSTATEMAPPPSPTKGSSSIWWISIPIVAVVVLICVGVAWWYFKIRDDKPPKSIGAVTATTGDTTSSAPVYGVIDKSKKKKSDKTDGNGMQMSEAPEYAAVSKPLNSEPKPAPRSSQPPPTNSTEKQELQYADIDHSNRTPSNQIRQPAEAPTEYATVQSVIV